MKALWKFFTSLRLTVVLLGLSVLLIFFGTLSQVDEGLWRSQKIWFESYLVTNQHLQLFGWKFVVPIFPGGYLIGFTLLAALILAFIQRFTWKWNKLGVNLNHGGVILLLIGQLLTQQFARESFIEFKEGQSKSYAEHHLRNELAFSHETSPGRDEVVVVPESMIKNGGTISAPNLPFTVRIKEGGSNCQIRRRGPAIDGPAKATAGAGTEVTVIPLAESHDMDSRNLPYAYVEIFEKEKSLGTWLVTPWLSMLGAAPQEISVAGKKFQVELRFERFYQPFEMTLLKTSNEIYRGTDIPKNFRSRVRVVDTNTREAREVDIYMNHPLRYAGQTFYQARMGREPDGERRGTSALQVVSNPSWLTPYVGCYVVAVGMYLQFRQHLVGFLNKRLSRGGEKKSSFWGSLAGRLLEGGVLGYLILKFTLNLFGYSS